MTNFLNNIVLWNTIPFREPKNEQEWEANAKHFGIDPNVSPVGVGFADWHNYNLDDHDLEIHWNWEDELQKLPSIKE